MEDIIKKLNWRYATKKYSSRKLSDKDFEELLEALRLSPSSYGLQPWRFIVVNDMKIREKIREAAHGQGQTTEASHLIVLCAKNRISEDNINAHVENTAKVRGVGVETLEGFKKMLTGVSGRKDILEWNKHQVYLALGVLLSACAIKDIDACPMEGYDAKKVDEILNLEAEGLGSVVLCPVGYRADDDKYSKAKKVRFSKEDVVEIR